MPIATSLDARPRAASPGRADDLIFDIGMNNGEDTDYYLKKGFRVVAVEADPTLCADVSRRYATEIARGQLTVLNKAISEARAPLRFYVCHGNSIWSTASPEYLDRWVRRGLEFEEIEVEGILPGDLIAQYGVPRYAKIDIEGFDLVFLRGLESAGCPPPTFLSVELDFAMRGELIGQLEQLGYARFALVGQNGVKASRQQGPAREGLTIDYTFGEFASGPFGEDVPQEWVDGAKLRRRCEAIAWQYRLSSALSRLGGPADREKPMIDLAIQRCLPRAWDWYDVHARL